MHYLCLGHERAFLTCTGLDTVTALPNPYQEPHVRKAEARCGHTIVPSCPVPGKTAWSSWVGNCSRRGPGMSCPACDGLGLGRAPHQSTELYLRLRQGKTRAGKGQKSKGEEEPDEEPQKKRKAGSFPSLCKMAREATGEVKFACCPDWWVSRGAGELLLGRGKYEQLIAQGARGYAGCPPSPPPSTFPPGAAHGASYPSSLPLSQAIVHARDKVLSNNPDRDFLLPT